MLAAYRSIMDGSANPLKDFPAVTRFQIVALLVLLATTIFVTGAGAWMWFGPLFVVNLFASRLAVNGVTVAQVRLAPIRRDEPVKVGASRRRLERVNAPGV